MTLSRPLILEKSRTKDVSLTPTERFFKPVIVIGAPCSRADAELIGCEWLFDAQGNAHHFEGSVKATAELSTAAVTLRGVTVSTDFKAEKIVHFRLARVEKVGLEVQMRIHLTEHSPEDLVPLLAFLSTLNKEEFVLEITSAQMQLEPAKPVKDTISKRKPTRDADGMPVPMESGEYDANLATGVPFSNKHVVATVASLEVRGGYIAGWHFRVTGKVARASGEPLSVKSEVYASESEAIEHAALAAHAFGLGILPDATGPTEASVRAAVEWLAERCPKPAGVTQ